MLKCAARHASRVDHCDAVYATSPQTITNRVPKVMNAVSLSVTWQWHWKIWSWSEYNSTTSSIGWMSPRGLSIQAGCDSVPVSAWAWTGTSIGTFAQVGCWPTHPNFWCCSSPSSSTICKPELSHCASLSTYYVRLSGFLLCWPNSLELAARWT